MQKHENGQIGLQRELMNIETFLEVYGINRSSFYAHVKSGKLKITKDGRRTLVKREDAQEWLRKLGTESIE